MAPPLLVGPVATVGQKPSPLRDSAVEHEEEQDSAFVTALAATDPTGVLPSPDQRERSCYEGMLNLYRTTQIKLHQSAPCPCNPAQTAAHRCVNHRPGSNERPRLRFLSNDEEEAPDLETVCLLGVIENALGRAHLEQCGTQYDLREACRLFRDSSEHHCSAASYNLILTMLAAAEQARNALSVLQEVRNEIQQASARHQKKMNRSRSTADTSCGISSEKSICSGGGVEELISSTCLDSADGVGSAASASWKIPAMALARASKDSGALDRTQEAVAEISRAGINVLVLLTAELPASEQHTRDIALYNLGVAYQRSKMAPPTGYSSVRSSPLPHEPTEAARESMFPSRSNFAELYGAVTGNGAKATSSSDWSVVDRLPLPGMPIDSGLPLAATSISDHPPRYLCFAPTDERWDVDRFKRTMRADVDSRVRPADDPLNQSMQRPPAESLFRVSLGSKQHVVRTSAEHSNRPCVLTKPPLAFHNTNSDCEALATPKKDQQHFAPPHFVPRCCPLSQNGGNRSVRAKAQSHDDDDPKTSLTLTLAGGGPRTRRWRATTGERWGHNHYGAQQQMPSAGNKVPAEQQAGSIQQQLQAVKKQGQPGVALSDIKGFIPKYSAAAGFSEWTPRQREVDEMRKAQRSSSSTSAYGRIPQTGVLTSGASSRLRIMTPVPGSYLDDAQPVTAPEGDRSGKGRVQSFRVTPGVVPSNSSHGGGSQYQHSRQQTLPPKPISSLKQSPGRVSFESCCIGSLDPQSTPSSQPPLVAPPTRLRPQVAWLPASSVPSGGSVTIMRVQQAVRAHAQALFLCEEGASMSEWLPYLMHAYSVRVFSKRIEPPRLAEYIDKSLKDFLTATPSVTACCTSFLENVLIAYFQRFLLMELHENSSTPEGIRRGSFTPTRCRRQTSRSGLVSSPKSRPKSIDGAFGRQCKGSVTSKGGREPLVPTNDDDDDDEDDDDEILHRSLTSLPPDNVTPVGAPSFPLITWGSPAGSSRGASPWSPDRRGRLQPDIDPERKGRVQREVDDLTHPLSLLQELYSLGAISTEGAWKLHGLRGLLKAMILAYTDGATKDIMKALEICPLDKKYTVYYMSLYIIAIDILTEGGQAARVAMKAAGTTDLISSCGTQLRDDEFPSFTEMSLQNQPVRLPADADSYEEDEEASCHIPRDDHNRGCSFPQSGSVRQLFNGDEPRRPSTPAVVRAPSHINLRAASGDNKRSSTLQRLGCRRDFEERAQRSSSLGTHLGLPLEEQDSNRGEDLGGASGRAEDETAFSGKRLPILKERPYGVSPDRTPLLLQQVLAMHRADGDSGVESVMSNSDSFNNKQKRRMLSQFCKHCRLYLDTAPLNDYDDVGNLLRGIKSYLTRKMKPRRQGSEYSEPFEDILQQLRELMFLNRAKLQAIPPEWNLRDFQWDLSNPHIWLRDHPANGYWSPATTTTSTRREEVFGLPQIISTPKHSSSSSNLTAMRTPTTAATTATSSAGRIRRGSAMQSPRHVMMKQLVTGGHHINIEPWSVRGSRQGSDTLYVRRTAAERRLPSATSATDDSRYAPTPSECVLDVEEEDDDDADVDDDGDNSLHWGGGGPGSTGRSHCRQESTGLTLWRSRQCLYDSSCPSSE